VGFTPANVATTQTTLVTMSTTGKKNSNGTCQTGGGTEILSSCSFSEANSGLDLVHCQWKNDQ
jgi:hypothetical protein